MGTIKKGILDGFSGQIGTVVGSSWKGIPYMRSLSQTFKDPHTERQMMHRSKLALTIKFLKPLTGLLRTGWKLYANRQSSFNAAMSYTFANAISGTYPDYVIDPNKALISIGSLAPAVNAKAFSLAGRVNFEWEDNSDVEAAGQTDKALIAVINPVRSQAVFDDAGVERSAGKQSIKLPVDWIGETVDAYLGFISEDGSEVANSVYLGSITVA